MTARLKSGRRRCCRSPIRRTLAIGAPMKAPELATAAMQAYLDWEYGLVEQLRRDARPWLLSVI